MQKILIIQTAFIGDVVLATALIEKIKMYLPDSQIDFLLRKGNESLLDNNLHINHVITWNKKENKLKNLFGILKQIRKSKYDKVINLQSYFSTGLLTALSGATETRGFNKNPLSFLFTKKIKHVFDLKTPRHEVEKNNDLIADFTDQSIIKPVLYPSINDFEVTKPYTTNEFITITPSSVWFTKKYPLEKWIEFIDVLEPGLKIYLLGGKENNVECNSLAGATTHKNIVVLAGKLNFLSSAALMKSAKMNYTNDSAPLHFASAVNAPVTGLFCSTVPAFGYTPLSNISYIVEAQEYLSCRPCGIHGRKKCPLGHFKCAYEIKTNQLLEILALSK